ncbi:MAG: hypothetical protein KAQ98_00765 [Bacteriovoracaceae bacterium]|nr:hypothetical protein [Bacteriovoracaceae bacterium]
MDSVKNGKFTKKILMSSVCSPIGPSVGDSESVGYELLHGQVTRAQHIYSPRVVHKQFALDYIAVNLDTSSMVLHYPSKKSFIKEIKKGYEYIAIAFVLSTAHHMKKMCHLIRTHAPNSRIILGGYGTVMSDEELFPFADYICREEGVGFMRKLLNEPPLTIERYKHPDIRSRLKVFGIPIAHTGMIFAGLGCPNGCDFCCTSHFFKKKHIRLLPTGKSVYDFMKGHKDKYPDIEHTILDEDFLLSKDRSKEYLELCRKNNQSFSTFCFASVKAISQYTPHELLEMGIDGLWVGYESKKAGYEKHEGVDIDSLIKELQSHGITVLTSMIVGIPYQTDKIAKREFSELMETRPALSQFLIYGPTPGTPFYEKVMKQDLMQDDLKNDRMKYYKKCTGFSSMVKHPFLRREEIEKLQQEFYENDFKTLGPSIFRIAEIKMAGYKRYRNNPNHLLRNKAKEFRKKLPPYLAILPVGILGPKISLKNRWEYLKLLFKILGHARAHELSYLLASPIMGLAACACWMNKKLKFFQHPVTRIYKYRGRLVQEEIPEESISRRRLETTLYSSNEVTP